MSEAVTPQIKRNVGLLAGCQALLLCNGVTLIAVNGLAGAKLAPTPTLATLTVTGYVIGTALMTLPASWFMKHYGRRAGFIVGALLGILGGLTCAVAVSIGSFWLLCLGTLCAGTYNAFGLQYRFAAADMAPADWKPKAISWTLAGGILGGFIGPWAGKITRDIWAVEFAATYASLSVFAVVALLIASRLRVPEMADAGQQGSGRPLPEIARQPAFVVAVLAAALGYGTMNLLMAATPLAMDICGLPFGDAAFVLQWHVLGMYGPSFFTGSLIKRFGVLSILMAGVVLMFACIALALSGVTLMHFWWALFLLGVGWNFLYIGGTTLLTETYKPAERAKVQGGNDFLVFGVQAVSSLSAGALVLGGGWYTLNLYAIPAVIVISIGVGALMLHRRRLAAAHP
ncbi:MFS transporter [Sulfuritalea sp.]|uniref:MFS transporter n=1 Tax=Sulfuritalea sp. TaxID=2480090 RepID=UPI001ACCFFED|nr:MFS transporter [Sulfuritalea sp.]MBN8475808.1 MFS transporter [Sulfuritalea sp.]